MSNNRKDELADIECEVTELLLFSFSSFCCVVICCFLSYLLFAGLWFWPIKVQQHHWMWEAKQRPEQIQRLHVSPLFSFLLSVCSLWFRAVHHVPVTLKTIPSNTLCSASPESTSHEEFQVSFSLWINQTTFSVVLSSKREIMRNRGLLRSQEFLTYHYDSSSFSKLRLRFAFLGCGRRVFPFCFHMTGKQCSSSSSGSVQPDHWSCSFQKVSVYFNNNQNLLIFSWFPVFHLPSFCLFAACWRGWGVILKTMRKGGRLD